MSHHPAVTRSLEDPGYTPARTELSSIIAELGTLSEAERKRVQRVLLRSGFAAAEVAMHALPEAQGELRSELVALLGRFAATEPDPRLLAPLLDGLSEGSPRCRRLAASALGKLGDARAEEPLLGAMAAAPLDLLRVIAEALGKVGAERAELALLARSDVDPEFVRRKEQARLLIARRTSRADIAHIELDRALPRALSLRVTCRRGLARLLAEELAAFSPVVSSDGSVDISHRGSLRELLVARTALGFGLLVREDDEAPERPVRIAEALTRSDTLAAVAAWTRGPARFRLEWQAGGHQRAASWAVAREVGRRTSEFVNDPRAASWLVEVSPDSRAPLRLSPLLDPDPRFAYRRRDVPAASHPTLAAALARVGGVRKDDVVWDPFVGSGLELVERALLGPASKLIGSDLDPKALAAARENLESAGIQNYELVEGDARTLAAAGVTLIITNPPMGRRVARDGSLGALLEAFVKRISQLLGADGRAVLLSPLPERTANWARQAGLVCTRGTLVDLGGFSAELQVLTQRR